MVWMKTPMMPTFRKLYGKIHSNFHNGDQIVFNITANYEVEEFDGEKVLVISTLGSLGGKNSYCSTAYYTIGSFALIFGVLLLVNEKFGIRFKM